MTPDFSPEAIAEAIASELVGVRAEPFDLTITESEALVVAERIMSHVSPLLAALEAEAVISKLHEYTDTDEELAMANAYAKEGWAWVDDFCEALGDGTTVFNFKERIIATEAALEAKDGEAKRYEKALQSLVDRHPDSPPGEHPAVDIALAALNQGVESSKPKEQDHADPHD